MAEFDITAQKKTRIVKPCPPCPPCPATSCRCGGSCSCAMPKASKAWDSDAVAGTAGLAGAAVGLCLGGPLGAILGFLAAGGAAEAVCKSS